MGSTVPWAPLPTPYAKRCVLLRMLLRAVNQGQLLSVRWSHSVTHSSFRPSVLARALLLQVSVLNDVANGSSKNSGASINIDPYIVTTKAWEQDMISSEVLAAGDRI